MRVLLFFRIKKKRKTSFFSFPFSQQAFTFLEVIIAIFIMIVGIGGTLVVLQRGISSITQARARLTAAYLAQEGIEIIRNIRDTNWVEQRIASTTPWDAELNEGEYEADYEDTKNETPSLTPCDFPCDYNRLRFLKKNEEGFYSYNTGTLTPFKRKISIEKPSTSTLKVTVTVYWGEGKHSLRTQEILYNWR